MNNKMHRFAFAVSGVAFANTCGAKFPTVSPVAALVVNRKNPRRLSE
jgi:hypothetical protein